MTNRRLRMLAAALVTVAVTLIVMAAAAQSRRFRRPPPIAPTAPFSLTVEDESGVPFQTFRHGGTTWVLGENGERYVVVVTNPTPNRVEAVITVDGRDAISGRVGDFRTNRGYVLPPYGSVRVEGFRQSLDSVATFRFTDPSNSYSSRMGTPQNVGIIGVAFFRERAEPPVAIPRPEIKRRMPRPAPLRPAPKSSSSGRAAAESDSNLGTEYGESRVSRVGTTFFERQSNTPIRVITLRYDDEDGLEARGIEVFPRPRPVSRPITPDAFPESGFAPPPPSPW